MKTSKLVWSSLGQAVAATAYIFLVSLLMQYAGRFFGGNRTTNLIGPAAILVLFVVSAAITGSLILGRSVMFYLDGRKADAVKLFLFTIGWLVVIVCLAFIAMWIAALIHPINAIDLGLPSN